jgi:hypothetical protein
MTPISPCWNVGSSAPCSSYNKKKTDLVEFVVARGFSRSCWQRSDAHPRFVRISLSYSGWLPRSRTRFRVLQICRECPVRRTLSDRGARWWQLASKYLFALGPHRTRTLRCGNPSEDRRTVLQKRPDAREETETSLARRGLAKHFEPLERLDSRRMKITTDTVLQNRGASTRILRLKFLKRRRL